MVLFKVIKEATKAVPFVKYAIGIAGIAAIVALVQTAFGINLKAAAWGTVVILALMTILFLLAKASGNRLNAYHAQASALVWAMTIIFISTCAFLVSSIFFKAPQNLSNWIREEGKGSENKLVNSDIERIIVSGVIYEDFNRKIPQKGAFAYIFLNNKRYNSNPDKTGSDGQFSITIDTNRHFNSPIYYGKDSVTNNVNINSSDRHINLIMPEKIAKEVKKNITTFSVESSNDSILKKIEMATKLKYSPINNRNVIKVSFDKNRNIHRMPDTNVYELYDCQVEVYVNGRYCFSIDQPLITDIGPSANRINIEQDGDRKAEQIFLRTASSKIKRLIQCLE